MIIVWQEFELDLSKRGPIWVASQPGSNPANDCLRIQEGKWKTRNHGEVCPDLIDLLEAHISSKPATPRPHRNGNHYAQPALRGRGGRPSKREWRGEERS